MITLPVASKPLVLTALVAVTCVSAPRFIGEWGDFYTVFIGHAWSGQALFSFLTGGRVVLTGGGGVEKDANKYARLLVGLVSLIIFLSFLFWPW